MTKEDERSMGERGREVATLPPPSFHVERHDSSLGQWCMTRWTPPRGSLLEGLVQDIWHFDGSLARLRERHFPTGRAQIVVHLGPRYRQVGSDGTTGPTFPTVCASGLLLGPDVIEAPGGSNTVLGVRLNPVGAWAVLGVPMDTVLHRSVDLEDVAGGEARRLVDHCAAPPTGGRATEAGIAGGPLMAAAEWIAGRVCSGPRGDPAVAWMVREIEDSRGGASIGALVGRSGWSATRMVAAFRREVGTTPKRFARIVRFRHVLPQVATGMVPLSRVALEGGYCDQPHLNADFREMAGFAPEAYRAAHRYPGSVSLAE